MEIKTPIPPPPRDTEARAVAQEAQDGAVLMRMLKKYGFTGLIGVALTGSAGTLGSHMSGQLDAIRVEVVEMRKEIATGNTASQVMAKQMEFIGKAVTKNSEDIEKLENRIGALEARRR